MREGVVGRARAAVSLCCMSRTSFRDLAIVESTNEGFPARCRFPPSFGA